MQEMQPMLYFKKERIMRKKTLALFLTCVLAAGMLAGCGNKDSKDNNQVENSQGTESAKDDQAAADEVAELIDAIYVQERTDKTDEQCAAAKEAWDKLTDAQKALVSGENADPDYFGRDTGDASKDDPLNQDNIGDELVGELDAYKDKFEKVVVAEPLLGEVGDDATVINDDKKAVAEDITAEAVKTAGYDSLDAAKKDGTAFVFMGHGTSHSAKVSYSQMSTQMDKLGYDNVFIGTVEGEPEETSCENVIKAVKDAGYKKVILRPLMVVAGDHANNDMAGDDDDSWKSQFTASGNFDSVDTQIAGLGEIEAVQKLYVEHTKKAIESLGKVSKSASSSAVSALEDGTYTAKFNTDSGMFHVNEADNGCGTLTVKDKKMTIHIRLVSKKIVNLFLGSAQDAEKDGAELLQPTTDKVKYSDGTTEEVYGFDVPVEELGKEFDLAILGTKGTWYDHKVSVSDAQKK